VNDDLIDVLPGEWEGTARTWFGPDTLADESPVRGRMRRVGSSRFLLHEYEGSFNGEPREGVEMLGLGAGGPDAALVAWIDTFHMNADVLVSRGAPSAGPAGYVVLGSWAVDPSDPNGERWGWRTELAVGDRDHLTITAYVVKPDGEESRATEVVYTRRA
jgi:hypothetical protein